MATTASVHARLSVEGEELDVLTYSLSEGLSRVDALALTATTRGRDLPAPDTLIGKEATFALVREPDGQRREFCGDVLAVTTASSADGLAILELELAPPLWRLAARTDCRVFRQKSVPDIVKDVLEGAGLAADEQSYELAESYPARDYVVQYRETDLDFLLRLSAEEGIFFLTEVRDGRATVVFTDDGHGVGDASPSTLGFLADFGGQWAEDRVFRLDECHSLRSDKVTLKDYDFAHPGLDLTVSSESVDEGPHALEVYQYPGRYAETSQGERLAKVLLEAIQADRDLVGGEAGVVALRPGYRFTVQDHPYEPLNQEYLVIATSIVGSEALHFESAVEAHEAGGFSYVFRFEAVPTGRTQYRAPRRDVTRAVPGMQTALTTGPAGEEIHTNADGQVTAKFPWDRLSPADDSVSCWMRTSQVPTGGSMLLPRVGWEVAVVYREGDVDQPFVVSRLYNGKTSPPYALPENAARMALQTATTPGGGSTNELRMSDVKGQEEMFFNASRDMSVQIGNNTTQSVGNDHKIKIGANQKIDVTDSVENVVKANHTLSVGGNQKVGVEKLMVDDVKGDHSLSVGGNRTHMVGGDHRHTVAGSASLKIDGNEINLVVGSVSDNTLASMTHEVGAALIEMTASDRSLIVGGARSESTGAAKIIISKGGRGVEAGMMSSQVGGAVITNIKGNRVDKADGPYSETAAGAQIVKANNVVFEAESALTVTMGGAMMALTPASISIAGATIKLDGNTVDTGMVIDN